MRKPLIAVFVGALVLSSVGIATASDQFQQTYTSKYSSKKPGTSTGINSVLTGTDPGAPNAKPDPATKVVIAFQSGTKFNNKAVPQCNLSKDQVEADPEGACPSNTKVGTGSASANAAPVLQTAVGERVTAFNKKGGIWFALSPTGSIGQKLALEGKLSGSKLTTTVPVLPIIPGAPVTPDNTVSLTEFILNIPKKGSGKKAFITSPTKCKGGKWTNKATFTYTSQPGVTVTSTTPCKA